MKVNSQNVAVGA